uniref:Uncharacterized protein n=1 Tax=Trichuris muris TaxID=70415 RepID=A0A5S6QQ16_TRIMR
MSRRAAIEWNLAVRTASAEAVLRNPVKIGGPGLTVEVVETLKPFCLRFPAKGKTIICALVSYDNDAFTIFQYYCCIFGLETFVQFSLSVLPLKPNGLFKRALLYERLGSPGIPLY